MYKQCVWNANGVFNCNNIHTKIKKNDLVFGSKKQLKTIYPPVRRIIAIGDLHGDVKKVKSIFIKAKLIKRTKNGYMWIGKDTYVVQVGDQIDYGGRGVETFDNSKEIEVLLFLDLMDQKARKHRGRVISLIGNHELMNVLGDFRFVSNKGFSDFAGKSQRKKIFSPGGEMAKYLAHNRVSVVQIGRWVFVHGGLVPYWVQNFKLHDINKKVKNFLLGNISLEQDVDLKRMISGSDSFFWTREFGFPKDENYCNKVNNTLKILKASGMVIGHSIHDKITSACSKKLWKVDVGLSRAFGQNKITQCLEIISKKNGYVKSLKIIK